MSHNMGNDQRNQSIDEEAGEYRPKDYKKSEIRVDQSV